MAEADRAPEGNGATPGEVPASLLNGMVVVSGVLVASVLLVSLHVHAHGPLYGAGASAAHAEFANFVSVVWGIGLSIIVALIYVPHLVLLEYAGQSAPAGTAAADRADGPRRTASLFQKVQMALAIFGPVIIAVVTAVSGPSAQRRGRLTQVPLRCCRYNRQRVREPDPALFACLRHSHSCPGVGADLLRPGCAGRMCTRD